MVYLLGCHIYRAVFDYGNFTLDFTGYAITTVCIK